MVAAEWADRRAAERVGPEVSVVIGGSAAIVSSSEPGGLDRPASRASTASRATAVQASSSAITGVARSKCRMVHTVSRPSGSRATSAQAPLRTAESYGAERHYRHQSRSSQLYSREKLRGAQGRNRTTDTAIFSRMLYQLSYLGVLNVKVATGGVIGRSSLLVQRFAPVERTGRPDGVIDSSLEMSMTSSCGTGRRYQHDLRSDHP